MRARPFILAPGLVEGPAKSLTHTALFADRREIVAFQYSATALPRDPQLFYRMQEQAAGIPDGSCVDAHGHVWNAVFGGGMVNQHDGRTGEILRSVEVPDAPNVTCVCLASVAGKTMLYCTSARRKMSEEELRERPAAGGVFAVDLTDEGVAAVPDVLFKWRLTP